MEETREKRGDREEEERGIREKREDRGQRREKRGETREEMRGEEKRGESIWEKRGGREDMRGQSCLPKLVHLELSFTPEVTPSGHWVNFADSSNHSLYVTKLSNSSYLEGNFGGAKWFD